MPFRTETVSFFCLWLYETVREASNNNSLNGRSDTAARRETFFRKRLGLMFVDGKFSREQRRFTLCHMGDIGFGLLENIQHPILIKWLSLNTL